MKKLAAFLTGAVIIVAAGGIAMALQTGAKKLPIRQYFPSDHTVAVWDWHNPSTRSPEELKQVDNFFYLHQINTVYVDISSYADNYKNSSPEQKQQLETALENYVNTVKDHGVRVFAGAGNTDWSKPDQRYKPKAIQDFVYNYNQHHPSAKLAGIEFDIEAYNQEGFPQSSNTEKTIVLSELLDTVQQLTAKQKEYINQTNDQLELGFAIPYWFDNENGNIPALTWNGKTGPTLYHLVDQINQLPKANIDVMAYRNAATGNDGSIFHSRTEVEYAQAKAPHVKVLVGQEDNDVEPAKITFYGTSLSEFSTETRLINDEFQGDSSYGGIAINDLAGLQQMDQSETGNILH